MALSKKKICNYGILSISKQVGNMCGGHLYLWNSKDQQTGEGDMGKWGE